MNINIVDLKLGHVEDVVIDEKVEVDKEVLKNTDILELKDTIVKGHIYNYENDYELSMVVSGVMVLACSITLEPVDYKFSVEINGFYTEMMEEIEKTTQKIENSLDIFPIIWENILMEIPIKVTSPEATNLKLSGDGWKLVTEESIEDKSNAFDKLKDLL